MRDLVRLPILGAGLIALGLPAVAAAAEDSRMTLESATGDARGIFCLIVFVVSYLLVMTEERTHLRKSKPVMLGAGLIWATIAIAAPGYGIDHEQLKGALSHDLQEYGSLALFLMAAMTYIAALEYLNVFAALRGWLIGRGLGYRTLFWLTGGIAFFLSAIADNMTTALVMGTVILAVGAGSPRFIAVAMIHIVNAANAGGAFSPFGDITTLMVWQSGHVEFLQFFALFLPSVVTFAVPGAILTLAVPTGSPPPLEEKVAMLPGARRAIALGLLTVTMAVCFEQFLGIPPFMGMMTGLSLLMFHGYWMRRGRSEGDPDYDILNEIRGVDWDTLLFFYGVMFSVGGLAFLGYLELASGIMYGSWGASTANVALGAVSAVIDNIPIMFSVLSMDPEMSHFQWLLITLTCGVGGSLLSVGSAAGVALMGVSKGQYTFMGHLRWTPVIALGYAAGIATHFVVNG